MSECGSVRGGSEPQRPTDRVKRLPRPGTRGLLGRNSGLAGGDPRGPGRGRPELPPTVRSNKHSTRLKKKKRKKEKKKKPE